MESLADANAVELLAGYGGGRFSPVEVVRDVLARIESWEPSLQALYLHRPEAALAAAEASGARWRDGSARALEGVPVTIKENVATAGDPMPLGTAARELAAAPADAPASARLKEAGAVVLGKTTMPDYGMLSSGLSSFHPLTRNPWDLSKGPGGSSSGAGAAAGAGYGPIHIGTDIGGSVRLPATWCGVFGLKPSFGRVPVDPPYWGRVVGPLTRTVADAALAMREISRPDRRDGMGLPPPMQGLFDHLAIDPAGLRIGLMAEAGVGLPVDPEVGAAVAAAAGRLAAAGARIEPVSPFLTRAMLDGIDVFFRQRAFLDLAALGAAERSRVLPYIVDWAEAARGYDGATVFRGMSQMIAVRDAALAAIAPFDFILSPVAPVPAFPAELASPLHDPARPFEHIAFTLPSNFSEQPAASVPIATTRAGLPIGLQVVGQRFDDRGVLALSGLVERLRPALPAWPAPPAAA